MSRRTLIAFQTPTNLSTLAGLAALLLACRRPSATIPDATAARAPVVARGAPREGQPCESGLACGPDGHSVLSCEGQRWVIFEHCRGWRPCTEHPFPDDNGRTIDCHDTVAAESDRCHGPGRTACRVDGRAVLECRGERMVVQQVCACEPDEFGITTHCPPRE